MIEKELDKLEDNGFAVVKNFLPQEELLSIAHILPSKNIRFCLEKIPEFLPLAHLIYKTLSNYFPDIYFNRSIYFNKSADNNWNVLWHQDLTLAVKEKFDDPVYGPWSLKDGINHVQPPEAILKNMITARLHFSECNEQNGALKVIPGSHRSILSRDEINKKLCSTKSVSCFAGPGDLVLMKPLTLHSSDSSSKKSTERPVLHLEFLTKNPPDKVKLYHFRPDL